MGNRIFDALARLQENEEIVIRRYESRVEVKRLRRINGGNTIYSATTVMSLCEFVSSNDDLLVKIIDDLEDRIRGNDRD